MPTEPQQQTGPFDPYLNPSPASQAYVSSARPQDNSGYQGKAGNSALIIDKFLEGMSHGRMLAFQRSEQENSQRLGLIKQKISEVQQANLPDATKQQLIGQLNQTFAQMVYHQIPEDDKKKGGKGGAQGGGDQPVDAGTHIRNALKGIVGGLIGPGAQKENISHEDLGKALSGVDTILRDPNQSLTAQAGQAGTAFNQAFDALVKKNGGKIPTTGALMQDPASFKAYQQGFSLSGKPTPEMEAILKATDQEAAKRAKIEEESSKQAAESARARETRESIESVAKIQTQGRHEDVLRREEAENARAAAKLQAEAPLRASETAFHQAQAAKVRNEIADAKKTATQFADSSKSSADYQPGGPSIANPKGNPGIDTMAWNWLYTDKLSFIGIGGSKKQQADMRQLAIERAGEIKKEYGITDAMLPALRATVHADTQSLVRQTSQGAMVSQFERTLEKNMAVARDLDSDFKRTGSPLLNQVISTWKTGTGSDEAKNLTAQLHGVAREWARIMSGQTGAGGVPVTEAAAGDQIFKAMTSGQLQGLFDKVITKDAKNRISAIEEEKNATRLALRQAVQTVGGRDPDAPPAGKVAAGAAATNNAPPATQSGKTQGGPPRQFKTADEYLKSLQK